MKNKRLIYSAFLSGILIAAIDAVRMNNPSRWTKMN